MKEGAGNLFAWAKLVADVLVPLLLAWIGYVVTAHFHKVESRLNLDAVIVSKRIAFYESISKDLNCLYCFASYIGAWREISPIEAIATKRRLDAATFGATPLISVSLISAYLSFTEALFEMKRGRGMSTRLRCNVAMHREAHGESWDVNWERLFVPESERIKREEIANCYQRLLEAFSLDFGLDARRITLLERPEISAD